MFRLISAVESAPQAHYLAVTCVVDPSALPSRRRNAAYFHRRASKLGLKAAVSRPRPPEAK